VQIDRRKFSDEQGQWSTRLAEKDALIRTLRQTLQGTNDSYAAQQNKIDMLQRCAGGGLLCRN